MIDTTFFEAKLKALRYWQDAYLDAKWNYFSWYTMHQNYSTTFYCGERYLPMKSFDNYWEDSKEYWLSGTPHWTKNEFYYC